MRAGYLPREGTIPARVIAHLQQHGGTLTSAEIAQLFGSSTNAATAMRKALDAGLVVAERDGHSYVFSLPEPTTASEPGDALQIASYSDGDVSVAGGVPCEDGAVMYSRSQIEQLVRHVTAPHIVLGAPAAP